MQPLPLKIEIKEIGTLGSAALLGSFVFGIEAGNDFKISGFEKTRLDKKYFFGYNGA